MEKCVDMSDMLDMIWTKIGKKCPNWQFWGIPHPNLATLWKSGNLGALKSAICGSGRILAFLAPESLEVWEALPDCTFDTKILPI